MTTQEVEGLAGMLGITPASMLRFNKVARRLGYTNLLEFIAYCLIDLMLSSEKKPMVRRNKRFAALLDLAKKLTSEENEPRRPDDRLDQKGQHP